MSRSLMPSRPVDHVRTGLLQITAAGFLWGTTGVVVQLVRQSTGLSPVDIGFYRLAIAAVVLVVLLRRRLHLIFAAARSAPLLIMVAGTGLGAYQALYFLAVAKGGVAVATVVSLGLAPILIAAWEAVRSGRMPARSTLCSLAAAVAGLALMTGSGATPTEAAPQPLLGLLAAIGSGLGYAATTVISRRISHRVEPLVLTATTTATGALTLLPIVLLSGGIVFPAQLRPIAMLAYLGVVTTAVAYALFYAGLRTTPGSAAVVLTLFEPLTAAVLAVVILGEPASLPAVAGGVLLLGAVVMTGRRTEPVPSS